mgnify:CR=1 FL=1
MADWATRQNAVAVVISGSTGATTDIKHLASVWLRSAKIVRVISNETMHQMQEA